jgi:hypothetical protein
LSKRIRIGSTWLRQVGQVESGAGGWESFLPATESYSAGNRVLVRFVETVDFGCENKIALGQAINGVCPNS